MQHDSVIKPKVLCAIEALDLSRVLPEQLEQREIKILRKILCPRYVNGQWRTRTNNELYEEM